MKNFTRFTLTSLAAVTLMGTASVAMSNQPAQAAESTTGQTTAASDQLLGEYTFALKSSDFANGDLAVAGHPFSQTTADGKYKINLEFFKKDGVHIDTFVDVTDSNYLLNQDHYIGGWIQSVSEAGKQRVEIGDINRVTGEVTQKLGYINVTITIDGKSVGSFNDLLEPNGSTNNNSNGNNNTNGNNANNNNANNNSGANGNNSNNASNTNKPTTSKENTAKKPTALLQTGVDNSAMTIGAILTALAAGVTGIVVFIKHIF